MQPSLVNKSCSLTLPLVLFFAFSGYCQKSHVLGLGTGLHFNSIKDDAMSPVRYRSTSPYLSLSSVVDKKNKHLSDLRLNIVGGGMHGPEKEYMTGTMVRLDVDYHYLKPLKMDIDSMHNQFFAGGSINTLLSARFVNSLDNSAIIYDNFNSFSLAGAFRRSFHGLNRKLTFYSLVNIPILSFGTRPDYMNLYDVIDPKGGDILNDALSRMSVRSFGSFQRISIRNALCYPIKGMNYLSLTYEWQYYAANFTVPVKWGSHIFSIAVHLPV